MLRASVIAPGRPLVGVRFRCEYSDIGQHRSKHVKLAPHLADTGQIWQAQTDRPRYFQRSSAQKRERPEAAASA